VQGLVPGPCAVKLGAGSIMPCCPWCSVPLVKPTVGSPVRCERAAVGDGVVVEGVRDAAVLACVQAPAPGTTAECQLLQRQSQVCLVQHCSGVAQLIASSVVE
jgi:hypothetical protein